jgi:hypothetical protein
MLTDEERTKLTGALATLILAHGLPEDAAFCQISILWKDMGLSVARITKGENDGDKITVN